MPGCYFPDILHLPGALHSFVSACMGFFGFPFFFFFFFLYHPWELNVFDLLLQGAPFLHTNTIRCCPSCLFCVWAHSQPAAELVIISLHVWLSLTVSNKFSLAPKRS